MLKRDMKRYTLLLRNIAKQYGRTSDEYQQALKDYTAKIIMDRLQCSIRSS